MTDVVIWHDVECGGYGADLPLWRRLALEADGPVLDLGAGTGRVALDLAEAGHAVTALDANPVLLDELARRAEARGLAVDCVHADVRSLAGIGSFALIIAPMQFLQILGGASARARMLAGVISCLPPGGRFAAAIANLDEAVAAESVEPPVPDVESAWDGSTRAASDVPPEPGGVASNAAPKGFSSGTLTEERTPRFSLAPTDQSSVRPPRRAAPRKQRGGANTEHASQYGGRIRRLRVCLLYPELEH